MEEHGQQVETDETMATNELNIQSWYDLFKDAYGNWGHGRDVNKTVEAPGLEPAADAEPSETIPAHGEIDDGGL